jgi:ABC-type transport system substrate-binding protein
LSVVQQVAGVLQRGKSGGRIAVVDPNPLNWLWITYHTVEELIRVTKRGKIRPAAMRRYRWLDDRTLEVHLRRDERFPDGERLTAATVKRSFDEQIRWAAPHPPGTHLNIDVRTRCETTGPYAVRFHLPEPDGLALGKLRATHLMSARFWRDLGFGYARDQSGEGHW